MMPLWFRRPICSTVVAIPMLAVAVRAEGQDIKPEAENTKMAQAMAKMAELGQPGPHHKYLDQYVGSWDTITKIWMDPAGDPMESKGVCETKWAFDGRFIMDQHKGQVIMPDETGKPKPMAFEGMGITGYDNYANKYVSFWVDNMGTQMFTSSGSLNPAAKTLTFYGTMDEPMLDVHGRMVKYVSRFINQDKHVFEIYDLHAGENFKTLEVVYSRRK